MELLEFVIRNYPQTGLLDLHRAGYTTEDVKRELKRKTLVHDPERDIFAVTEEGEFRILESKLRPRRHVIKRGCAHEKHNRLLVLKPDPRWSDPEDADLDCYEIS